MYIIIIIITNTTNTTATIITIILLLAMIFPHVRLEVHHLSKAGVGVPSPVVPGPDVPAITFNASFHHPLLDYILYSISDFLFPFYHQDT